MIITAEFGFIGQEVAVPVYALYPMDASCYFQYIHQSFQIS